MSTPVDVLKARLIDADTRCDRWLDAGNAANEARNYVVAEIHYEKGLFWLCRRDSLQAKLDAALSRAGGGA